MLNSNILESVVTDYIIGKHEKTFVLKDWEEERVCS
jgi:hypothetical protein